MMHERYRKLGFKHGFLNMYPREYGWMAREYYETGYSLGRYFRLGLIWLVAIVILAVLGGLWLGEGVVDGVSP